MGQTVIVSVLERGAIKVNSLQGDTLIPSTLFEGLSTSVLHLITSCGMYLCSMFVHSEQPGAAVSQSHLERSPIDTDWDFGKSMGEEMLVVTPSFSGNMGFAVWLPYHLQRAHILECLKATSSCKPILFSLSLK